MVPAGGGVCSATVLPLVLVTVSVRARVHSGASSGAIANSVDAAGQGAHRHVGSPGADVELRAPAHGAFVHARGPEQQSINGEGESPDRGNVIADALVAEEADPAAVGGMMATPSRTAAAMLRGPGRQLDGACVDPEVPVQHLEYGLGAGRSRTVSRATPSGAAWWKGLRASMPVAPAGSTR